MINFATLQGLTIPEGVVTQITDASGRVIWAVQNSKPVVLQVAKVTSNTYAGETSYTGEQFILLDIYPKTNGTVKVTYGGLTKTITDTSGVAEPNARQVFFGTFNGASDSVTTPESGELMIEGEYDSFACSSYQSGSKSYNVAFCSCITAVNEWGDISQIMPNAFRACASLALTELPSSITSIGENAFLNCTSLALAELPNSITNIGGSAFSGCTSLALKSLPSGLTSIGGSAFKGCTSLALTSLPNSITFIGASAFYECGNITVNKMPSGMTAIPDGCFEYCTKVDVETFDYTGITTIGKMAFYQTGLVVHTLKLPEGIISIGDAAFYCVVNPVSVNGGPEQIHIPSTVTDIGGQAFRSVYSGTARTVTVYCNATVPPTLAMLDDVYKQFHDYPCTIIVPKGCRAAYQAAAGWSEYASYIREAS